MSEVIKSLNHLLRRDTSLFSGSLSLGMISVGLMWLFTISALVGISLGYVNWFIPKTPINLLLGFLLLILNVPFGTRKGMAVFFCAFAVGMSVEILGVATGEIFGVYTYGDNLGFKVAGVPVMIGIYWAILVIVTSQIARHVFKNIILAALAGASLMVGLDFVMEHLASIFDFWHFSGGLAGIQNYVAWFVVAFLLHILAYQWLPSGGRFFSLQLYLNQVTFFAISYLLLVLL